MLFLFVRFVCIGYHSRYRYSLLCNLFNNKWGRDAYIALTQIYPGPSEQQIVDSVMEMAAVGTLRMIAGNQLVPTHL